MAKYQIKFSCGHSDEINLSGKISDRTSRVVWLEKGTCYECNSTKIKENIKKNASDLHLISLGGSEKQINWANAIRHKRFQEISAIPLTQLKDRALVCIAKLKTILDSKFWIETKDQSLGEIFIKVEEIKKGENEK